jgi:aspartate-semialdehyde dehydrogenase
VCALLKRLAILGSTGSIGQSTLSIVEQFPDRYQVAALAAGRNSTKPSHKPSAGGRGWSQWPPKSWPANS